MFRINRLVVFNRIFDQIVVKSSLPESVEFERKCNRIISRALYSELSEFPLSFCNDFASVYKWNCKLSTVRSVRPFGIHLLHCCSCQ